MAEYIDKADIYKLFDDTNGIIRLHVAEVDQLPAADAAPVVHGRWEHLEDGRFDLWRCTACGDEWTFEHDPTNTDTRVKYCPNCGARMDGDDHET